MRFAEILLGVTTLTGLIWAVDSAFFKHHRMRSVIPDAQNSAVQEPWWVEYAKAFFPVLLLVLVLRSFLAEPFRIPSGSMHPTLIEGDFVLVNKYTYGLRFPAFGYKMLEIGTPKRGDIIVFKHGDMDLIKRVVGLPKDHIQYKDKVIYVNGKPITQTFETELVDEDDRGVRHTMRVLSETLGETTHQLLVQPSQPTAPSLHYPYDDVTVPDQSYFVMGDNRDNSKDSRMWGFVPDEAIQGRAFGIWMSLTPYTAEDSTWQVFHWISGMTWDKFKHWIRFERLTLDLH